jgi:anti-anti-sigma factor
LGRIIQDGRLVVDVEQEPDRVLVRVSGEVDFSQAELLEMELKSLGKEKPVVVDLSRLGFIDSTVMASLIRAADEDDCIEVRGLKGQVKRLFDLFDADLGRTRKPA